VAFKVGPKKKIGPVPLFDGIHPIKSGGADEPSNTPGKCRGTNRCRRPMFWPYHRGLSITQKGPFTGLPVCWFRIHPFSKYGKNSN